MTEQDIKKYGKYTRIMGVLVSVGFLLIFLLMISDAQEKKEKFIQQELLQCKNKGYPIVQETDFYDKKGYTICINHKNEQYIIHVNNLNPKETPK